MKVVLAIGGAVIKTAHKEIKQVAKDKLFDVLVHNGASVFHDFQIAIDPVLGKKKKPYYSMDQLLKNYKLDEKASNKVWDWALWEYPSPSGSLTSVCKKNKIETLLFVTLGCDFWHLFEDVFAWESLARLQYNNFNRLCQIMTEPFYFINMGSAVMHPEIFSKAVAKVKPKEFKADVVDFKRMYRPEVRVARYGKYHLIDHKNYLQKVIEGEIKWRE